MDKELYGETFRAAPRLTPLEARAIRLALEYVGPMIAAESHTPLKRVRKKLEETFGQFDLVQTPEPHVGQRGGALRLDVQRGDPRAPPRRDRVPEGRRGDVVDTRRRAVLARARASQLARAHAGIARATASAASVSTGCAAPRCSTRRSTPREGFEPSRLRDARTAQVLYTKEVARWALERGARPLVDGTALADLPVGSPEWLESEIFSYRGEAVVLEPDDLRNHVRDRAKQLAAELGVNRLRIPT